MPFYIVDLKNLKLSEKLFIHYKKNVVYNNCAVMTTGSVKQGWDMCALTPYFVPNPAGGCHVVAYSTLGLFDKSYKFLETKFSL